MKCFHISTHRSWVVALLILAAVPWSSKAEVPVCPLQAPAHVIKPGVPPPGWEVRVRDGPRLSTAGVLAGPFDGAGYLAPEKSQVRKDGESQHFTQAWDLQTPANGEKWLYCGYGSGLELYKRLPDSLKACTMKTSVYKDRIVKAMTMKCDT